MDIRSVKSIEWLVHPNQLPLRLVLYRLIKAAGGPIHIDELRSLLTYYEVASDDKALHTRLGELVNGVVGVELKVGRVMAGVYLALEDE